MDDGLISPSHLRSPPPFWQACPVSVCTFNRRLTGRIPSAGWPRSYSRNWRNRDIQRPFRAFAPRKAKSPGRSELGKQRELALSGVFNRERPENSRFKGSRKTRAPEIAGLRAVRGGEEAVNSCFSVFYWLFRLGLDLKALEFGDGLD